MSEWIPVSERLPDDDMPVLVCYDGCVNIGGYGEYEHQPYPSKGEAWGPRVGWWGAGEGIEGDAGHAAVTHWMPLPEPPEAAEVPRRLQPEPCEECGKRMAPATSRWCDPCLADKLDF